MSLKNYPTEGDLECVYRVGRQTDHVRAAEVVADYRVRIQSQDRAKLAARVAEAYYRGKVAELVSALTAEAK